MSAGQGAVGVWLLWAMLAVGAILVLASLRQASERFWHWKRARQVHVGEVTPSDAALRVGQSLAFAAPEIKQANSFSGGKYTPQDTEQQANDPYASQSQAHVTALSRGLLWFTLEAPRSACLWDGADDANTMSAPRKGETLLFTVTGEDALYRFEARVRETRPDPASASNILVCITLPFWVARAQRRQHVRVPVRLRASFQPARASTLAAVCSQMSLRGTLLDLSGGGLRVELEGAQSPNAAARLCEQLPAGTTLEVTLDTPLLRTETLRVRVRDVRRVAARGGLGVRLRAEFVALPAWQRETLSGLVFQAQRAHRQNQVPNAGSRITI